MSHCASPAIVLRRRSYGDYDLILTALTQHYGVCTLIAKSAKKSVKRFPGILEPFAGLHIVFRKPRGKGMPVLAEANLEQANAGLRSDVLKTAYASYWCELVALWLEEGEKRSEIYSLLSFTLNGLSEDVAPGSLLSLLFQMRFIGYEGLQPILERCTCCHTDVDAIRQQQFCVDLSQGGIVCNACPTPGGDQLQVAKGTLKQLLWMANGDLNTALRVRFSNHAMAEATLFMEAFVPYHIGRMPKSLTFLRQMRKAAF